MNNCFPGEPYFFLTQKYIYKIWVIFDKHAKLVFSVGLKNIWLIGTIICIKQNEYHGLIEKNKFFSS